jgi:FG-GAP-like repeat
MNYLKRILGLASLVAALISVLTSLRADEGFRYRVEPLPHPPETITEIDTKPGMLPDGLVTHGNLDVAQAWLTGPTKRYRHGILGDAIEASGLAVKMRDGSQLEFKLDPHSVFEDRYPRLHDLDGDGDSEIIVVRSYLDRGAALVIMDIIDGRLQLVAETPAIGTPNRWLNPIGAADFDGDGFTEIALVRTPHIGGTLILYRWKNDHLEEAFRAHGYSNHAIGSRQMGLSAILDVNGDAIPDIVLPDGSRNALRMVTFANGRFRDLVSIPNPSRITSRISVERTSKEWRIVYGLEDGTGAAITPN